MFFILVSLLYLTRVKLYLPRSIFKPCGGGQCIIVCMENGISAVFLQAVYYASLPGAAALFCVLVFTAGERRRGRLLMLSLSAALSLNTLLKMLFKVPRPWLMHAENAPFLAEGGYALPCTHTQLISAVLCTFALTSRKRPVRFLCAAGI